MKRVYTILIAVLTAVTMLAATYSVDDIPNVHLQDSTRYVSNPDGILSQDTQRNIDAMLNKVRRTSSAEPVMVVVDDIDSDDIDDFATELFGKWGLGKSDLDNGLLILVAKDMRKAVIRPGYGLEGVLPDIVCARILREQMFPAFKRGDYDGGMTAASETVAKILMDPSNREEILSSQKDADFAGGEKDGEPDFFTVYLFFCGGITLVLLVVLFVNLSRLKGKTPRQKYLAMSGLKPVFLALTVAGLGMPLIASLPLVAMLWRWRNRPHKCPRCGAMMKKVDEVHDNEFLASSQDMEERIGSVDYDVWLCPKCGETDIEQYVTKGTPYHQCERCHAYTSRLARTRVLRQPTTVRTGEGVREYSCLNCGWVTPVTYTIPMIVVPPVIVSGGRHGGGGGNFGGFGGGGFGGGMTGGGGASGGW